jgi:hypothetical protein
MARVVWSGIDPMPLKGQNTIFLVSDGLPQAESTVEAALR